MLSKEESKWSFYVLGLFIKLHILPLHIDQKTGRISSRRSKIWLSLYLMFLVYTIRLTVKFLQLIRSSQIVSPHLTKWDHLAIHFIFNIAYIHTSYWIKVLFFERPIEARIVFNELFNHEDTGQGMIQGQDHGRRSLFSRKFQYSRHELVALLVPFSIPGTGLLAGAIFFSDPSRLLLLYSSVPVELGHWALFLVLTLVDVLVCAVPASTALFCLSSKLLFLQKCEVTFATLLERIRSEPASFSDRWTDKMLKDIYNFGLYIHLFNRCYAFVIFSWKLLLLCVTVISGFFTICFVHQHPITGLFTLYVSIMCTSWYAIVYEKAFEVLYNWKRVKGQLRLKARLSKHKLYMRGGKMAEYQKKIQRIREIGVEVGQFNVMERISTPNFIHFVVNNVVSLLITFA